MRDQMPITSATVLATVLFAGTLSIVSVVLAMRRRAPAYGFWWIAVAGLSYSVLGMAAALQLRTTDGMHAALMQLLSVILAGALWALCSVGEGQGEPFAGGLSAVGRALAWLTLVGLPPTVGFHSKVMIYRALLTAGWPWLMALAMAGSAAALVPAIHAIEITGAGATRRLRSLGIVLLIALVVFMGVYPASGLFVAAQADRLAGTQQTALAPELDLW
jgi:NADH:ubiquinone oxidoreductase subunit 2 (subunit N)